MLRKMLIAHLCGIALCWAIDLEDMDIEKRAPPVYWSTPARRSLVDFGQTPGQESDCARPAAMVALRACRSYCAQNYKKFPVECGKPGPVTSMKMVAMQMKKMITLNFCQAVYDRTYDRCLAQNDV